MNHSSNLRLLIWNDSKTQGAFWKSLADEDGFSKPIVIDTTIVEEFLDAYRKEEPDLIITDILHKEETLGLKFVKKLRTIDSLVPIVAVTIKPDLVFKDVNLEEYGFCGIYPNTIFQRDLVATTIRQALNIWHAQVPEFALARGSMRALLREFPDGTESLVAPSLRDLLLNLPYTGSINSWHGQVCDEISSLLEKMGFKHMKNAFDTLAEVFQKADPFFMAGSQSRRHLSHNVQVFLLGITILLADTDLREHAIKALTKGRKATPTAKALDEALLVWACVSLTHDAGYLSQHMPTVFKELVDLANIYAPWMGMEVADFDFSKTPLHLWRKQHHAAIASQFWMTRNKGAGGHEAFLIRLVAAAIDRHDSHYAKEQGKGPAKISEWASFLAVLCDELQDWQRVRETSRAGEDAPWRSVAVERIQVGSHPTLNEFALHLDFVLQDYASLVTERVGRQGTAAVKNRFKQILAVLEENVVPSKSWNITLSADFVSRSVPKIVEHGKLRVK